MRTTKYTMTGELEDAKTVVAAINQIESWDVDIYAELYYHPVLEEYVIRVYGLTGMDDQEDLLTSHHQLVVREELNKTTGIIERV